MELYASAEVIKQLWSATDRYLVVVEPGTPDGFRNVLRVRDYVIKSGGRIVAPVRDCCILCWSRRLIAVLGSAHTVSFAHTAKREWRTMISGERIWFVECSLNVGY